MWVSKIFLMFISHKLRSNRIFSRIFKVIPVTGKIKCNNRKRSVPIGRIHVKDTSRRKSELRIHRILGRSFLSTKITQEVKTDVVKRDIIFLVGKNSRRPVEATSVAKNVTRVVLRRRERSFYSESGRGLSPTCRQQKSGCKTCISHDWPDSSPCRNQNFVSVSATFVRFTSVIRELQCVYFPSIASPKYWILQFVERERLES